MTWSMHKMGMRKTHKGGKLDESHIYGDTGVFRWDAGGSD